MGYIEDFEKKLFFTWVKMDKTGCSSLHYIMP